MKIFGAHIVFAFCCVLCLNCSNRPLEDAQVYGVYVANEDEIVDLLMLDPTRRYTRMFWTRPDGPQIYSGDWALFPWQGDDRIDFHDFNRLYEVDYPRPRGSWFTYVDFSLFGRIRLPLSPDDGKWYYRESERPEEAARMFDSLVEKCKKR